MEILINPSEFFNHQPFMVKVNYNETIENVISIISLTLINTPITKMSLRYNRKAIKKNLRLDQIGINYGETLDLVEHKSSSCLLL
jgi:hypothetical protein